MSINKLQLKRSAVVGKIPTTASLDLGELAINTIDGKIYFKQQDTGSTQRILELTTTSGSMLSASYAQTASYSDQFRVAGTLTAQTLIVQTVSSSIIYSSGSNIFGNNLANTQIFTGSVSVTGSLTVNGRNYLTDSSSFSTRTLNLEQTSASVLLATASLYTATASLYAATSSIYLTTASLYNFSASINTYTASNNATVLDIQKATASLYAATASLYAATASLNITTASLYNFSASINSYTSSNNATVLDIQRATASLYNASASLYTATASLYAASASINSFSASILNFTSSQLVLNGKYATTSSNTFIGTQTVTGSVNVYGGGFNVDGVNVLDTALAYAIALG
jgi:hypothetical protein